MILWRQVFVIVKRIIYPAIQRMNNPFGLDFELEKTIH